MPHHTTQTAATKVSLFDSQVSCDVPQDFLLIYVSILATTAASIFFGTSAVALLPTWHVFGGRDGNGS